MRLDLKKVDGVRGIYAGGKLPDRMRWLHPDAARAFGLIAGWVIVSDMFRSAESSLRAVREGRGARAPGFSAHNYGLAIDIDVKSGIEMWGTKHALDMTMIAAGWHCHRVDSAMRAECWHYNYLGDTPHRPGIKSTGGMVEQKILSLYSAQMRIDVKQAQAALTSLRMYSGAIDGVAGPLTAEALRVFQRAWGLRSSGALDAATARTLAYVAT